MIHNEAAGSATAIATIIRDAVEDQDIELGVLERWRMSVRTDIAPHRREVDDVVMPENGVQGEVEA